MRPSSDTIRSYARRARFSARRLFAHRPLDRETLREYWSDPPDEGNVPEAYLNDPEGPGRSEYLVELLNAHSPSPVSALELGCNAGRNLKFLHAAGWTDLAAIEVSENALAALRKAHPELAGATLLAGSLEDELPKLGDGAYGGVFSMAVLEHVHYDSDWLMEHVVRVAGRLIVTIENETDVSDRTFPRNYRRVFERLGARQVHEDLEPRGHRAGFVARVFTAPT